MNDSDAIATLQKQHFDAFNRADAEGMVRLEAKEELKSRLGRSPDRADAVAMCLYAELRRGVSATWGKS